MSGIQLKEVDMLIKNAIDYANEVVHTKAISNKDLAEMGTTLEVCIICENKLFIGHVGDSRVYIAQER